MGKVRLPNFQRNNKRLKMRIEKYLSAINSVYDRMLRESLSLASLFDIDQTKPFSFNDYPETKSAFLKLQKEFMNNLMGVIMSSTSEEWKQSNLIQDLVARKVLKVYTGTDRNGEEYTRYFRLNSDALKAFQNRVENGMNLSKRVWNLTEQYKTELEESLSAAIDPGTSAMSLAADVKQYLKEPDKRFRKIRDKFGNLQLSDNAKAYHPGTGVYRSSARNAQRLARTEINMAYRTAEQKRWEQFDFVVGFEVNTTQNGHHVEDICDELAGKYPKSFDFKGWHPQCYSDDSEVLTGRGWKLFKDVLPDDAILSLNPATKEMEWVNIVTQQCYERDGKMIWFHNRSLDCLVTPEHRMVYLGKNTDEIRYAEAMNFRKSLGAFYRGAHYHAADVPSFQLEDREVNFDDFCEFMGYYLSDGSIQHGTGVVISQKDGEPARLPIIDVARRMEYNPKLSKDNVNIYNSALNRYVARFGTCRNKFIPSEIKNASPRQIRIFLDAFLKCDGYIRGPKCFIGNHGHLFRGKNEERVYFTTSEQLAADLSELILKVGNRPSFALQPPSVSKKKDGTLIRSNYSCWKISECHSSTATVFQKDVVNYSGKVYDLTLSKNHIMYIRRNGKCFWGSNCMCYCIPILKTEDEFMDYDPDSEEEQPSVNEVIDVPDKFKDWIHDNEDRITAAEGRGTLPYFIKDNKKVVDGILNKSTDTREDNTKSPQEIARIEANRKEYERLKNDKNYKDVEFNPKNGGLKATHSEHNIDKEKGWYETKVQEIGFQQGHSVILEKESGKGIGERYTEGSWDGSLFELASCETGTPNNIVRGLKHCSSKDNVEVAVIFLPNTEYNDPEFTRAISRYIGMINKGMPFRRFKRIICLTQSGIMFNKLY